MKCTMTDKQFETCKSKKAVASALRILRAHIKMPKFKIGDVVVAYYQRRNHKTDEITEELIMQNEGNPTRWVVCHIDEDGIIFAKQILSSGKFGQGVYCLAELGGESYRFDIDPDFLELVLLGQEDQYNPIAWTKDVAKKRAKLSRLNKSRELEWNDVAHAQSVIDTWKVGDTLYKCSTSTPSEKHVVAHKIKAIHKHKIPDLLHSSAGGYLRQYDKYERHRQANLKYYYEVEMENHFGDIKDFYIYYWYIEKPATMETL